MNTLNDVVNVVREFMGPVVVLFNPSHPTNAEFLRRYDEIRDSVRTELGLTESQLATLNRYTALPASTQVKFNELQSWLRE